jgi:hypothetical protein
VSDEIQRLRREALIAERNGEMARHRLLMEQIRRIDESAVPVPEEESVMSRAISNIPESAGQFARDFVQPFLHPIDTAKSLADLATGVVQLAIPGEQGNEQVARAVGEYFKDRYGGLENIKETFANDPIGFLGDVSVVLTAGGSLAGRAPGIAGKVGDLAQTAGRAVDPALLATKVAGKGASVAGTGLKHITGITTGAGSVPIEQAFRAGAEGGQRGRTFVSQMRGTGDAADPLQKALAGLKRIRDARGDAYRTGVGGIDMSAKIDPLRIMDPYMRSMQKYIGSTKRNPMFVKGGKAVREKLEEIDEIMRRWGRDPEMHTLEYADDLKRQLDRLWETDPVRGGIVTEVRNKVRNAILEISPEYADVMADYERMTGDIQHLERELSLGSKNPSTTLRKLQSATRDNVNTAYGSRIDLANMLDPSVMPGVSGQALSSPVPRGWGQAIAGGQVAAGVLGAVADPVSLIPSLLMSSPRAMGEVSHALGQATRLAPVGRASLNLGRSARPFMSPLEEEEERRRRLLSQ